MTLYIRPATPEDAKEIQSIYAPIVTDTAVSFEADPPGVEEMERRIVECSEHRPWLVCDLEDAIAGYAYAAKHRERPAYQWSVEVSVYVLEWFRRLGIGRALYTSLLEILNLQGFNNVYAGVALPNPASVALHESLGFKPVGVYEKAGFKLGAWHDVGWWCLALREHDKRPAAPKSPFDIQHTPEWEKALAAGLPFLKL